MSWIYLLHLTTSLELHSKPLFQWPTYSGTISKIELDEEGQNIYQGQVLERLPEAKAHFENFYQEYCLAIIENIRSRLSWSDLQLFHDVLATQGWQKILEEYESNPSTSSDSNSLLSPIHTHRSLQVSTRKVRSTCNRNQRRICINTSLC